MSCHCELSRVKRSVMQGCGPINDVELKPFVHIQEQLSIQEGCILWGSRVVIPISERERVIAYLHDGHPGI